MIGDDVKEHPRFSRPLRGNGFRFKFKIHTNVFLASVGVPYFPNTQAKSKSTIAMYHLSDLEICKKKKKCSADVQISINFIKKIALGSHVISNLESLRFSFLLALVKLLQNYPKKVI